MTALAVGTFVSDPDHAERGRGFVKEINEGTGRALVAWANGIETLEWLEQMSIRDLALYNPRHAIEGWLGGYEANGDTENAERCRAALALQDSWRAA
jgi:hypothetical protein